MLWVAGSPASPRAECHCPHAWRLQQPGPRCPWQVAERSQRVVFQLGREYFLWLYQGTVAIRGTSPPSTHPGPLITRGTWRVVPGGCSICLGHGTCMPVRGSQPGSACCPQMTWRGHGDTEGTGHIPRSFAAGCKISHKKEDGGGVEGMSAPKWGGETAPSNPALCCPGPPNGGVPELGCPHEAGHPQPHGRGCPPPLTASW